MTSLPRQIVKTYEQTNNQSGIALHNALQFLVLDEMLFVLLFDAVLVEFDDGTDLLRFLFVVAQVEFIA